LDADVELRFDNGYNINDDPLYVVWLRHEHPAWPIAPTAEESAQINDQVASDLISTSAEAASVDSSSGSESLSLSFATYNQTTYIRVERFDTSKGKCNKNKGKAQVLTSNENLLKRRRKKMKKQNRRSKTEEAGGKREKETWKARRKGTEGRIEAKKKPSSEGFKEKTRKQSDIDPVIGSEPEEPIESGLQSHEISNDKVFWIVQWWFFFNRRIAERLGAVHKDDL